VLVDPQVETSPADSPPSAPEVVQQQQKAKVEQQAERIQDREHREVKAVVVLNGVMVVLAFVLVVVGFASWKRRRLTQDLKRPPTTAENSIQMYTLSTSTIRCLALWHLPRRQL
jgi:cytoskeletal protein RodZ